MAFIYTYIALQKAAKIKSIRGLSSVDSLRKSSPPGRLKASSSESQEQRSILAILLVILIIHYSTNRTSSLILEMDFPHLEM